MSEVKVVYRKYGGALHWHHAARRLGEDEHGVWLGFAAGTVGRRGLEPPVVWELPAVLLFPRDAWWTASFNPEPHTNELYCDVTTVPEWRDGEVTMVDLDLDVIRPRGGDVFLDDADEFEEHQRALGYPPEIIAAAEESAGWLMAAVTGRRPPFDGTHLSWLAKVT
ncbi:hypothetical protein Misp01_36280 [Microtetraspora sp. NBRC 13810]|uniref:DUF402 domain-containing protein n=1 Tax=Microtetraspora sp. NBRC 13810 TaxID=3030990 RepID=UPI0024A36B8A|nr:DUF402 domain-containing protein [Microtetraspora sp. NBRC 13810]GLW08498.1 hypothetical protein Misp01_36280 [Microtetraspora sp. NBRC 13810]